jgi:hypothetical protein
MVTINPPESALSSERSKSLSGGVIAGIVVGAIAGICLVGAAFFFARRAIRKTPVQLSNEHGPVKIYAQHVPVIHEMGTWEKRPELNGQSPPSELSSGSLIPNPFHPSR